ncbi:MAG TPA: hypothetical protein VNK04_21065 [Gemmataceae bacterium]|nr:hypothetical protein [Gemmataceae bacterium]
MQSQPSERAAVVGKIDPQLVDNATKTTEAVDMAKFGSALFILLVGATDITVDAKLEESNAFDFGSGVSDISGKAIGQAAATDDNKVWIINLKAEECSKRYVRLKVTTGDGASGAYQAAVALGLDPRFGPASDDDLTAVDEIVT